MRNRSSNEQELMLETIEYLCRKPRTPGSEHSKECARYLRGELEKCGYRVEEQKKEFTGWRILEAPRVTVTRPEEREMRTLPVFWSAATPDGGIEGTAVPAGKTKFFESFSWDRWAVMQEGRIGAYLASSSRPVFVQPLDDWKNPVPHVIIGNEDRTRMMDWLEKGIEVRVNVSVKATFEQAELTNLIANPAGEITACAHYDSMPGSPGANDNASGVAGLLELAKRLAGKNVRFMLFDAEELNKLGSYAYVSAQENPGIKLVLELDSIGSGDRVELLASEKIAGRIKETCPDADIVPREKIPFSDCWPFMKKGIPAIRMLSKGNEPYQHFHSPQDTPDKISAGTIEKAADIAEKIIRSFL